MIEFEKYEETSRQLEAGNYKLSGELALKFLDELEQVDNGSELHTTLIFNTCGHLIDSGANTGQTELCIKAVNILKKERARIQNIIEKHHYFYNLANGIFNSLKHETFWIVHSRRLRLWSKQRTIIGKH